MIEQSLHRFAPPCTRLTTPFGRPTRRAARTSAPSSPASSRTASARRALPHAIAYGRNHSGIIAGKLNGVTDADDAERLAEHELVDAASRCPRPLAPIISDGMPQATSTFSMPRRSSPSASASVLPHSSTMSWANSGIACSRRCLKAKRNCTRSPGGVRRQAGNAALAAAHSAIDVRRGRKRSGGNHLGRGRVVHRNRGARAARPGAADVIEGSPPAYPAVQTLALKHREITLLMRQ